MTLAVLVVLRYLVLFVAFDTFHTPTQSMTPTIPPGYHGRVNKLKLGGRVFNFIAAAEGRPFTVRRLPGYGKLERNDIIVFNAPWTDSWDSVAMNMRLYYCKRVVAVAGDTLEIRGGHYKVRGFEGTLGVSSEQDMVKAYVDHIRLTTPDSARMGGSVYTIPYDSLLNWTINEMGPLVVPAKGMTVKLDHTNYLLYRKYIEWETGAKLFWNASSQDAAIQDAVLGDTASLDGEFGEAAMRNGYRAFLRGKGSKEKPQLLTEYTFTEDYCFAAGDHAIDSQDSRYWGFLPEKFIVGTVPLPTKMRKPPR